jgi:hypothetical protein
VIGGVLQCTLASWAIHMIGQRCHDAFGYLRRTRPRDGLLGGSGCSPQDSPTVSAGVAEQLNPPGVDISEIQVG